MREIWHQSGSPMLTSTNNGSETGHDPGPLQILRQNESIEPYIESDGRLDTDKGNPASCMPQDYRADLVISTSSVVPIRKPKKILPPPLTTLSAEAKRADEGSGGLGGEGRIMKLRSNAPLSVWIYRPQPESERSGLLPST
jgi:hypothetical protein